MSAELKHPKLPRADMQRPLDLIPQQTPIDATRILLIGAPQLRSPRELLPATLPHLAQHMPRMLVLLLVLQSLHILLMQRLVLPQPVASPPVPAGGLLREQVPGHDVIPRGIMHVDYEVVARGFDHHIDIELQLARDALLDAEMMVLIPLVPRAEFRERKECAENEREDRPLTTSSSRGRIRRFRFCYLSKWNGAWSASPRPLLCCEERKRR